MKKYLIAVAAALMFCLLGVSASAKDVDAKAYNAAMEEQARIADECYAKMDAIDPNGVDLKTQKEIMTEVYKAEGWTVTSETPNARSANIDPKTLELACSDIDKADPEMREKILDAREKIIFQNDWYNDLTDGASVGYTVDPINKKLEFIPAFSEVFPGWDPPRPSKEDVTLAAPVESVIEGICAAKAA